MHVTMKVSIAGTRDGADWPVRGGCIDLPADEAAHMCQAGLAEPCLEHVKPVERAVAPPAPRTASTRRK